MNYVTVFRTSDLSELSGIKEALDREGIEYQVLDEEAEITSENPGFNKNKFSLQVAESQREKAETLIKSGGATTATNITSTHKSHIRDSRRPPMIGRWVIFLLVALVVLVAIILFVWFMIPE